MYVYYTRRSMHIAWHISTPVAAPPLSSLPLLLANRRVASIPTQTILASCHHVVIYRYPVRYNIIIITIVINIIIKLERCKVSALIL